MKANKYFEYNVHTVTFSKLNKHTALFVLHGYSTPICSFIFESFDGRNLYLLTLLPFVPFVTLCGFCVSVE